MQVKEFGASAVLWTLAQELGVVELLNEALNIYDLAQQMAHILLER